MNIKVISIWFAFLIITIYCNVRVRWKGRKTQQTYALVPSSDDQLKYQQEVSEMEKYLKYWLNTKQDPCENFYQYVCKNYKHVKGRSKGERINNFLSLEEQVQEELRHLVENPFRRKKWNYVRSFVNVQILYQSCMDTEQLNRLGVNVLLENINTLGGWPLLDIDWNENDFDWITYTYKLGENRLRPQHFLDVRVDINRKKATNRITWIAEGSNYMNKEVMLKGMNSKEVQTYLNYQLEVTMHFGANRLRAMQDLKDAMELGIEIASIQMSATEIRDLTLQHNIYTIKQLLEEFPFVPWLTFINRMFSPYVELTENDEINVQNPKYLRRLHEILKKTPKRILANYMIWFVIKHNVPFLSDDVTYHMDKLNLDYGGLIPPPRWKKCLALVETALPIEVNTMYAWKFREKSPSKKYYATTMIKQIKLAASDYIKHSSWMNKETREKSHCNRDMKA